MLLIFDLAIADRAQSELTSVDHCFTEWPGLLSHPFVFGEKQPVEICNGEHLDDLLMTKDNSVKQDTLLLLYNGDCEEKAKLELRDEKWPPRQHVLLMTHDWQKWPHTTWFSFTKQQNIRQRYFTNHCLTGLLWRQGWTKDTTPLVWEPTNDMSFKEWAMGHLVAEVILRNALNVDVLVLVGDERYTLGKADQIGFTMKHIWQDPVLILDNVMEEVIAAFMVTKPRFKFELTHINESFFFDSWKISRILTDLLEGKHQHDLLLSHADRHRLMLLQPQCLRGYTRTGWELMRMPEQVHRELLSMYERDERFESEYYSDLLTAWNQDEVHVTQTTLTSQQTQYISRYVRPLLEEWSGETLQMTSGEGVVTRIRKYKGGARVRMHVDEVETGHVFGVILQVTQAPQAEDDPLQPWLLQLVSPDGRRQGVSMHPGDMLMFESSLVIHGRPEPLQTQYYVNSFLYYKPVGWKYVKADCRHRSGISHPERKDEL